MISNALKIVNLSLLLFYCQIISGQETKLTLAQKIEAVTDSVFNKYLHADQFLSTEGEHTGVQGGVVSIVTSDSIHALKAYGLSNVKSVNPFDAIKTNVMIASVSKIITATAAMTLIENGKLDLESPVNTYLPESQRTKHKYTTEILVKHLLTHSAGFDDSNIFSESRPYEAIPSLETYITEYRPDVVWEPGRFYNYSNFGFVLLAYLIEIQSNVPFNQYVADNVLKPLGMNDSGFEENEHLLKNLMTRYRWNELEDQTGWLLEEVDVKRTNRIGAAGFKTTASDMGKLLRLFLGPAGNDGILSAATIEMMLSSSFSYGKELHAASGLAWQIDTSMGTTIYSHAGNDRGIESKIIVVPNHDFGLFFSMNNSDGATIIRTINSAIKEYLQNENPSDTSDSATDISVQNSERLLGKYQYMNDGQNSFEKVIYLFGNGLRTVSNGENNALKMNSTELIALGENLFSPINKDTRIKFFEHENAYYLTSGFATYRQLKFWENPSLHLYLLMGSMLFLVSSFVWPFVRLIKPIAKKKNTEFNKLHLYLFLSSFSLLLFFILFVVGADSLELKYGVPTYFRLFLFLPIIGLVLFTYPIFLLITKSDIIIKSGSIIKRIHSLLVIISLFVVYAIFGFYNLVGFNF